MSLFRTIQFVILSLLGVSKVKLCTGIYSNFPSYFRMRFDTYKLQGISSNINGVWHISENIFDFWLVSMHLYVNLQ